ncbi:MAG: transporter substrate-binding domain-containing protein [Coriobacteriales bacterium]|nr:transporter substrate-binding domain-containing protein [Coriobacteriales bacterium]
MKKAGLQEAILTRAPFVALSLAVVFALILVLLTLGGCSPKQQNKVQSLDDIATARIGIFEGSIYDQVADELYPDAPKLYYKTAADILTALQTGKVDCMFVNRVSAEQVMREIDGLNYLDEYLGYEDLAPIISPNRAELRQEINEVLAEMKDDGTLEELQQKWLYASIEGVTLDDYELSGENGTLSLATGSDNTPFALIGENGEIVGYDIEFMMIFASRKGYALNIENMNFAGMLAAISANKYDLAATGITITPERAEAVLFTDPTATVPMVCLVRDESSASSSSFIEYISDGIQSTFIYEGRYRLIVLGIGVTLALTALSAALGTVLGLLLFRMKRSRLRAPRLFAAVIDKLTGGLPAVVILLILAYMVFGSVPIGGFWVAVIGFSIIFAAGFSETMLVGVDSVSDSQTEAALALGFKRGEAFRLVVLPQATRTIIQLYSGQLAELLKGTAIVGYIAVDDLTRASDLIRSVTFDAFFPLVASALVYLLIIWLMVALLRAVEKKTGPGRAKRARKAIEALARQ